MVGSTPVGADKKKDAELEYVCESAKESETAKT
jgi:hypothetical protein